MGIFYTVILPYCKYGIIGFSFLPALFSFTFADHPFCNRLTVIWVVPLLLIRMLLMANCIKHGVTAPYQVCIHQWNR